MHKAIILVFITFFTFTAVHAHSQTLYYWQDEKGQLQFSEKPAGNKNAGIISIPHQLDQTTQSSVEEHYRQVIKSHFDNAANTDYCRHLSSRLSEFRQNLETRRQNGLTGMAEYRFSMQIKRLDNKINREC